MIDHSVLAAHSEAAQRHLEDCGLCPFECGTARKSGDGICGVNDVAYIASEMLHMGEERLLHPAHAIFFIGCTARCTFCAAAKFAFQPAYGIPVTPNQLAQRIVQRQQEGARSICFIGGEPTPHIPFILQTLLSLGARKSAPTVFNSNFYLSAAALDLLQGAIDIYLPDLKFGPNGCGERLGSMPDYWNVVTKRVDEVHRAGYQVVVRHLLMPGHVQCCTEPVLRWLAQRTEIQVSLLDQYVAAANAEGELTGSVSESEHEYVWDLAHRLHLQLVH